MDISTIRELANIVRESSLSYLEVENDGLHVILKTEPAAAFAQTGLPAVIDSKDNSGTMNEQTPSKAPLESDPGLDFNAVHTVKSPMIGVFYSKPSPEAEPFVKIGSKVKKGNVLCIIEAMKLMNDIVAEKDGEIVDICVSNGDVVEYGQILFKIF